MKKIINLGGKEIEYDLKISRRARRMRLTINGDGNLTAIIPFGLNEKLIERFMRAKADWIVSKIELRKKFPVKRLSRGTRGEYLGNKKGALVLAKERLKYFNEFYGFKFSRISIRNQKTRWGSCSKNGNISFNYKIVFLLPEQADYIIVHELCHLGEMNHSKRFWALVAKEVSNYKKIRKEIRGLYY